jgi:hypothetical protein
MTESDLDTPLTVRELMEGLKLDLTFHGWSWSSPENRLEVKLTFHGEEIAKEDVYIEPAGYEREKDGY